MKDLRELTKAIEEQKFTLAYPSEIDKIEQEHPIFKNLMAAYQDDDNINRILAAIINAAINQNRVWPVQRLVAFSSLALLN